jgi:hypothetical protein
LLRETNSKQALEENAMKKILSLAGLVGIAIAAGTIHSQAARQTVAMSAAVGGICSISAPTANNGFGTGGNTLIATATGGKADAKTASMTLPYNCNTTNVSLQLTSDKQGITKNVSPPAGQTNKIHYTAKIFVNSSPIMATLNTASASTTTPAIHNEPTGNLNVEVNIPVGTLTLVPGSDYADSLFIDVLPNP